MSVCVHLLSSTVWFVVRGDSVYLYITDMFVTLLWGWRTLLTSSDRYRVQWPVGMCGPSHESVSVVNDCVVRPFTFCFLLHNRWWPLWRCHSSWSVCDRSGHFSTVVVTQHNLLAVSRQVYNSQHTYLLLVLICHWCHRTCSVLVIHPTDRPTVWGGHVLFVALLQWENTAFCRTRLVAYTTLSLFCRPVLFSSMCLPWQTGSWSACHP